MTQASSYGSTETMKQTRNTNVGNSNLYNVQTVTRAMSGRVMSYNARSLSRLYARGLRQLIIQF